jgi:replicative DNA helicase
MMKNVVDRLFRMIAWGKKGKNKGLAMGLPRLEKFIAGIQRKIYTLIAGGTGSGKTTFALYAYIYKPLMEMLGDPRLKIIYYSLEMTAEVLLAKLASIFIWEQYGVDMPFDVILSRTEVISDEHYEILLEVRKWLEDIQQHLIIYDKSMTCDGLYAHLREYAEENGEFYEDDTQEIYTPNVEGQFTIVILDHIGLLRRKTAQAKKEAIDAASNHLIYFRNKCGYSPVVLMQVNRTSSSMDRRNAEMQELQLDDIKDSGTPSEDADLVMAIFNPFREKMSKYRGFIIPKIREYLRSILILKNRYGDADKFVAMNFFGSVGLFKELPDLEEYVPTEQDYAQWTSLFEVETENAEVEGFQATTPMSFTL